jgi:hypothetical protein
MAAVGAAPEPASRGFVSAMVGGHGIGTCLLETKVASNVEPGVSKMLNVRRARDACRVPIMLPTCNDTPKNCRQECDEAY